MANRTTWAGSLHQSFRFLPADARTSSLAVMLGSHGKTQDEILDLFPYDRSRPAATGDRPDARRYRDAKQIYQSLGLCYEDDGVLRVTELGQTVRRWLPLAHEGNVPVLGRHIASALSACQLRTPARDGQVYDAADHVFPYVFIWQAMHALDDRIDSEELNRAVMKAMSREDLESQIAAIRAARETGDISALGERTIDDPDRVIPWVCRAGFGWMFIADKREDLDKRWYRIRSNCVPILREASRVRHLHREFDDMASYVEHISAAAAPPSDLR